MGPYRMAPPELEELRRQLKELLAAGSSNHPRLPMARRLPSTQQGDEHLRKIFKILRQNELYVKKEKCSFAKEEVSFLGHRIRDGKLMMDNSKVKAIQEWDPPTKVPQLRSFLGLVNYYRRFIKGYSARAAPLTDLLKKNKAWEWDERCQQAFEDLKKVRIEEPCWHYRPHQGL
ncbi:hypothetical protein AAG906_021249 [Vitis piasezkii]